MSRRVGRLIDHVRLVVGDPGRSLAFHTRLTEIDAG
jgi:hypothetical protein